MAKGSSFYIKIKQQQQTLPERRNMFQFHHEGGEEDTTTTCSIKNMVVDKPLIECPKQLFLKKGAKREKALELILNKFTNSFQPELITRGNSITLFHRCLDCIKSDLKSGKPTKETYLASLIIGLLPLDIGCGNDNLNLAHEIVEDSIEILTTSISKFYQALKPGSDYTTISCMLDSLAVITFVGGIGVEDTERSMEIIWRFLHEELASKPNTQVIISAISAWSFLLASIQTWSINSKLWKGSISYLTNLLEKSDQSVLRIVAAETLAHVAEINAIEKFSLDAKDLNLNEEDLLTCQGDGGSIHEQKIRKLKDKIKSVVVETSINNSSGKKDLKSHLSLSTDIIGYLKSGDCPKTSVLIGHDELPISNWSQLIQVDYMQRFLGSSFVRHVMQNEMFENFYDFTPRAQAPHQPALYVSSKEEENEGIHYIFQPEISIKDPLYFRLCISENSILNKRKTQLMKKQQALSASKNAGYFSVSFGDDEG